MVDTSARNQMRAKVSGAVIDKLARDIRKRGLLDPITVYEEGGKYIVVDGHTRYAALIRAGIMQCEAYVVSKPLDPKLENNIRNTLRTTQHLSVQLVEELAKRLQKDLSLTHRDLAEEFALTLQQVSDGMSIRKRLRKRGRWDTALREQWPMSKARSEVKGKSSTNVTSSPRTVTYALPSDISTDNPKVLRVYMRKMEAAHVSASAVCRRIASASARA